MSRHRVLKLPAEARVPANEGVFEAVVQPGIISHRARRDLVHRSRRELQHAGQILCLRVQIARAARQAARKQDVAVAGEGKRVAVEDGVSVQPRGNLFNVQNSHLEWMPKASRHHTRLSHTVRLRQSMPTDFHRRLKMR